MINAIISDDVVVMPHLRCEAIEMHIWYVILSFQKPKTVFEYKILHSKSLLLEYL